MLIQANRIDSDGFIIEPVIVLLTDVLQSDVISVSVPEGTYIPKWTGSEWIEGATEEYKNAVDNPQSDPSELEVLRQENTLLKAQVQASSDRSDFQEELISEMAMLVYP
ncbi:hypothetical protein AF332_07145 [Sporosarcina globispora]|uniref:Bacteriophage SP-beta YorD domain-containing protein n=1 Tax=Sporosarcina globispora TaxID=1459 RepID=A0A0M0G9N2_SPOGL|nr:hypothetical protein [Sporosarcina globispora]KON86615.1 hypothetical protein AF332_07145 [Sporosarcina globispora]